MQTTFIYALCEPDTGEIRYIGKANDPEDRLSARYGHIGSAKRGRKSHISSWIRVLLKQNKLPRLDIVMEVPRVWWPRFEKGIIARFRRAGARLVNMTDGGDGLLNPSQEVRDRIGRGNRGRPRSEEFRRKQRLALRTTNLSGVTGVSYLSNGNKWKASIRLNDQTHFLGYFDTREQAAAARNAVETGAPPLSVRPPKRPKGYARALTKPLILSTISNERD